MQRVRYNITLHPLAKRDRQVEWDGMIFCRGWGGDSARLTVFVIEAKTRVTYKAVQSMTDRVNKTRRILEEMRTWDRNCRPSVGHGEAFRQCAADVLADVGGYDRIEVRSCLGFFKGSRSRDLEKVAGEHDIATVRRNDSTMSTVLFPYPVPAME